MVDYAGSTVPQRFEFNWDNQETLKLLLEAAPIAIVTVDGNGRILYANAKLEELFGYQRQELLGQKVEILMPERFRTIHVQHRAGFSEHPHVRHMGSGMDLAGRRKDGSEFPIEAGLNYARIGNTLIVISSITDLSRRKENEALLEQLVEERTREIERRRRVAEGLRDILAILNSDRALEEILEHIIVQARWLLNADAGAICHFDNTQFVIQASVGLAPEQRTFAATGFPVGRLRQALSEDRPLAIADVEPASEIEQVYRAQLVVPIMVKDEAYGTLMLFYKSPRKFSIEDVDVAVTVGDQTALAIENERLRTKVERAAVTAERNRIARDLHDSVTQTLFSASLIAEVLPRLWDRNRDEANRRLGELRELTRGALAEMRTLLLELRPTTLIEVELSDLLRLLTAAITGRARVPITLEMAGDSPMPPDVKIAIYHVAQEALNNVAKHARARHAAVILHRRPEAVDLTIEDDGSGFIFERVKPEHLGLNIMRERAEAIGAQLTIQSQPDRGTTVTLHWPNHSDQ
ncbi:MAG: PAS domain S-box protein [Caldilineaceae bacterium]